VDESGGKSWQRFVIWRFLCTTGRNTFPPLRAIHRLIVMLSTMLRADLSARAAWVGRVTEVKYKIRLLRRFTHKPGGAYQQEIVQKVIQRLYTRFSIYPQRNKLSNHSFFCADRTADLPPKRWTGLSCF
jgi:hypothetical protein